GTAPRAITRLVLRTRGRECAPRFPRQSPALYSLDHPNPNGASSQRRLSAQRSAAVSAAGEAASSPPLANAGETPARQPARTPALRSRASLGARRALQSVDGETPGRHDDLLGVRELDSLLRLAEVECNPHI